MIRILHTFQLDDEAVRNGMAIEPGLLAIIDVKQKEGEFFIEPGSAVRIHRPDGTYIDRNAEGVSISGGNVGLFFLMTEQSEIPASSEIEICPQSATLPQ